MFSSSACGNKVSPASLLNLNECSADTGIMSGGESQLSQMSLFSNSEATNSLELFSQPPSHSQRNDSATICEFPGGSRTIETKVSGGKKYYTKYLSVINRTAKQKLSTTKDIGSIPASHSETRTGNVPFESWKEMQQEKFDIKCLIDEVNKSIKGIADETVAVVKENYQNIMTEIKEKENRLVEERSHFANQLAQTLKEQKETRNSLSELRTEVIQQRSILMKMERQLSSMSSMPQEAIASYAETMLAQLREVVAAKPHPTCTAHMGTQTLPSSVNSPSTPANSGEGQTDQSVPSVLTPVPVSNTEDEKLFGEEKESETKWQSSQWQQHRDLSQHQNQQQLPLFGCSQVSRTSAYSGSLTRSGGRTHVSLDLDPSPVYDLDLTQLPMVIEKETCDSVRIERKVVYGKRHLVDRSPFGLNKLELPRKTLALSSSSNSNKKRGCEFSTKRRSKRNTKKVPEYCYSSSESEQDEQAVSRQSSSMLLFKPAPAPASSKLHRKVSSHCQDSRLVSHRTSADSQGNGFDDAFFSGSLAALQSSARHKDGSTAGILQREKFNRSNESVRRRLKVISSNLRASKPKPGTIRNQTLLGTRHY